ncbi:MAG TPA: four helix bundle protein [Candidatus Dojkabacteria bacterium]|nr:four helix bundle protein [Candidatus Dojkabacteria bacterium]
MKPSILKTKSQEFGSLAIDFYKFLNSQKLYEIAKQFLKSATSIGANISESKYAESKKDFIHKLHIALKEAVETEYWIELLKNESKTYKNFSILENENKVLIFILTKSIRTAKQNEQINKRTD